MGSVHRFLAFGADMELVHAWFAALPSPPDVVQGRDCQFLFFSDQGPLQKVPQTEAIDPALSPIASLIHPKKLRGLVWTAGELHFLATPLRIRYPQLESVNRRFGKWLRGYECVFDGTHSAGEWDYFLEGELRNYALPIFALPEAMSALRQGQYFVSHDIGEEQLRRLCRSLELRGFTGI